MSLLGDTGQFVTLGRTRITSVMDDGAIHVSVAFAAGEASRDIEGFSPAAPRVAATDGSVTATAYDAATHRFRLTVAPGADGSASVTISRATESLGRAR
jgi:hypothetical protein